MLYHHHIEGCFAPAAKHGDAAPSLVPRAAYTDYLARAECARRDLATEMGEGQHPFLDVAPASNDWESLQHLATRLRTCCADVMVLGTGGSSLGGRALCALAGTGDNTPAPGARLWFVDNVDGEGFARLLERLHPQRTGVVAISKSGTTVETLCQWAMICDWMKTHDGQAQGLARRGVVICQPGDSPLRRMAKSVGAHLLDHDPKLGGRYSAFSPVGLVPAMIAGLDAHALCRGAANIVDMTLGNENRGNESRGNDPDCACPPVQGAALAAFLIEQARIKIVVVMPYNDRLCDFALWHRQLWAESLGKDGRALTPAPARGAVDQHSQLQLYLDGPNDKFFTLIATRSPGTGAVMKSRPGLPAYLSGRRMDDVMQAQLQAVGQVLSAGNRPVRRFEMGPLTEETLGALLMHFMLETVLTARIIGVDPFDQPAVEEGKILARTHLSALGGDTS